MTKKHNADFGLVVGLMEVESVFNPLAKSKADARGLLQIMYKIWGKTYDIKHPSDLYNIEYNIDIGVHILKHYLKKNNGNIRNALQNYNGSEGTAFSNKVFTALGKFTAYRNNSSTWD
ncbi:MAG: hypothetical protein DRI84_09890 [Bacteroidetes bacterium]|nr:MAG: hypothetical protein DRI84_09890 [Bacteroidota bacterium]